MKIEVISLFRDCSQTHLVRWANQVERFVQHVPRGYSIYASAVEGDSVDGTRDRLQRLCEGRFPLKVVDCQVGVPKFPSCVDPIRLAALSQCLNAGMEEIDHDTDQVCYVESDLIWDPVTLGVLSDVAREHRYGADIISPMIMVGKKQFYDIWAFRKNGRCFDGVSPFYMGLNGRPLELDSVGSCLVFDAEIGRRVRVTNDNALVGWCEQARRLGYQIFVDPNLKVEHPA